MIFTKALKDYVISNLNIQHVKQFVFFLILVIFGFSIHFQDVLFTTADDFSMSQLTYSDHCNIAMGQGRIGMYLAGMFSLVPYLVKSFFYFKAVQILSIVVAIISIGSFLSLVFRNKQIGYIYSILALLLWQNTSGHNFLSSYFFYVSFAVSLFMLSLSAYLIYLRTKSPKYIFTSLFFWFTISFSGIDFWIVYTPFFVFLGFYESQYEDFKNKLIDAIQKSKWHISVVIICTLSYFIFMYLGGGTYGGRTLNIDFSRMLYAWFVYSVGLFPGLQFYFNLKSTGLSYLLNAIDFRMVFVAFLVLYILLTNKDYIQSINKKIKLPYFIMASIYAIIAPTFLISWTIKYQNWAIERGVHDYLYSSYSFLAVIFIVLLFTLKVKHRVIYFIFSFFVSVFVLLTQINNAYVRDNQAQYSEKLFLLDAFLTSQYVRENSDGFKIVAPSLWDDGIAVREQKLNYWDAYADVWSKYAFNKIHKKVTIIEKGTGGGRIDYIRSKHNNGSYMLYSEDGSLKSAFVFKTNCNKQTPCFLLSQVDMNGELNFAFNGFTDTFGLKYFSELGTTNQFTRKVNTYDMGSKIQTDNIGGLLEHNPYSSLKPIIEYGNGFYALENDNNDKWRWASGHSSFIINTTNTERVKLQIDLQMASSGSITVKTSTIEKSFLFDDTNRHKINLILDLDAGANTINILPSQPPVKLNRSDDRLFSYRVLEIRLNRHSVSKINNKL